MQTARANGLKVKNYLKYLISNINKEPLDKPYYGQKYLPEDIRITTKKSISKTRIRTFAYTLDNSYSF